MQRNQIHCQLHWRKFPKLVMVQNLQLVLWQFSGGCSVQHYIHNEWNSNVRYKIFKDRRRWIYCSWLYQKDGGGNKIICAEKSSSNNSTRENTYGFVGTSGNIPLAAYRKHISKIIETQWYQITLIAIRKYYGTRLSKTPMSIFEEIEKESTFDWSDLDIPNYEIIKLNHEK